MLENIIFYEFCIDKFTPKDRWTKILIFYNILCIKWLDSLDNLQALRAVWYMYLNICFQFLNNIIRIFTHFFTYTYFQKIQITFLE